MRAAAVPGTVTTTMSSSFRFIAASVVLAGTVLLAGDARANGRYPQAMQLLEDPSDADRLWLRTTYGVVASNDRGATWTWICEEAMGFSSASAFDPMFGVHESGTLLIGLTDGLRTSSNHGCDWQVAPNTPRDRLVMDLAVDQRVKSRALVLISYTEAREGGTDYVNEIWQTTDNAATFSLLANNLPPGLFSTTLDSAPSDPNRIYVSAMGLQRTDGGQTTTAVLARSDDRGKTWKRVALPARAEARAYIAAIDPRNADIVYVGTHEVSANESAGSALLYTSDGGESWREVFRGEAPMLGFALAPEGDEVMVGLGDPGSQYLSFPQGALGLWRAPTTTLNFEKIFDKSISCLTWSPNGLFACSRLHSAGFDVGVSTDRGQTFKVLQARNTVRGPMACGSSSGLAAVCTHERWAQLCDKDLGCVDAGPPDGGAGGGPSGELSPRRKQGGCGCRLPAGNAAPDGIAVLSVALVAARLRRRLRRAQFTSVCAEVRLSRLPAFRFDLHSEVSDLELRLHAVVYHTQSLVVERPWRQHDVCAHRIHSGSQRPNMQIVNARHPGELLHGAAQCSEVDVRGRALEEHADRFLHEDPCARKDEQANASRQDRIGQVPARRQHDETRHENSDGREQVAEYLEVGALHV